MTDRSNPTADQLCEFENWLSTRPESVRALAKQLTPFAYYRIKATGQLCSICAYFEDGTVRVQTRTNPRSTLGMVWGDTIYEVFGYRAEDLEQLTDRVEIENARLLLPDEEK